MLTTTPIKIETTKRFKGWKIETWKAGEGYRWGMTKGNNFYQSSYTVESIESAIEDAIKEINEM